MFAAEEEEALPAYNRNRRRGALHKIEYVEQAQRKKSITSARQEWVYTKKAGKDCKLCKVEFDFFVAKRHCKMCGETVCDGCSKKKLTIPGSSTTPPVRVCDGCHRKITKPETAQGSEKKEDSKSAETGKDAEVKIKDISFKTTEHVKGCGVCNNTWDAPKGPGFKCPELDMQVHQNCKVIVESANALGRGLQVVADEGERDKLTKGLLGKITVHVLQASDLVSDSTGGRWGASSAANPYVKVKLDTAGTNEKKTLPQKDGVWSTLDNNTMEMHMPLSSASKSPSLVVEVSRLQVQQLHMIRTLTDY
jgi:hypothetical protein